MIIEVIPPLGLPLLSFDEEDEGGGDVLLGGEGAVALVGGGGFSGFIFHSLRHCWKKSLIPYVTVPISYEDLRKNVN